MSATLKKMFKINVILDYINEMEKDRKGTVILTFFGIAFAVWQVTRSSIAFWGMVVVAIPLTISIVTGNIKGWNIFQEKKELELIKIDKTGNFELDMGKHYYQMDFLSRNTTLLVDVIGIEIEDLLEIKDEDAINPEAFATIVTSSMNKLVKFNELINLNVQMVKNPFEEFVMKARGMSPVPTVKKEESKEILDILNPETNGVVDDELTPTFDGAKIVDAENDDSDIVTEPVD